jgi:hypothetical protein
MFIAWQWQNWARKLWIGLCIGISVRRRESTIKWQQQTTDYLELKECSLNIWNIRFVFSSMEMKVNLLPYWKSFHFDIGFWKIFHSAADMKNYWLKSFGIFHTHLTQILFQFICMWFENHEKFSFNLNKKNRLWDWKFSLSGLASHPINISAKFRLEI